MASSPKRSRWEMKRGEDGAAVKAHRPWGRYELWDPQEDSVQTGNGRFIFAEMLCLTYITFMFVKV